jgi:hypothetical protein
MRTTHMWRLKDSTEEPVTVVNTHYHVHVEGFLWGGGKGEFTYNVNKPPLTVEAINAIAGDFESVTACEVIEDRVVSTRTVLRIGA